MNHKLLNEYDDHFMMKHPDGTSFPIAKRGLSKDLIDKIRKTPKDVPLKMADGGEVPVDDFSDVISDQPIPEYQDPASVNPIVDSVNGYLAENPALQDLVGPSDEERSVASQDQDVSQGEPVFAEKAAPATVTASAPTTTQPGLPGTVKQISGIQGIAKVNEQSGKDLEQSYKDYNYAKSIKEQEYNANRKAIIGKVEQATKDYESGKIDPNRMWSNTSTGNKVLAAIAIALGGIGSGLTGKSNLALDTINKSIENDIEHQKSELGKKENLISKYMQQGHDLDTAMSAARIELATSVNAQAKMIAARQGSQNAINQAKILEGGLANTNAKYVDAVAKSKGNLGQQIDRLLRPEDKITVQDLAKSNAAKEAIANQLTSFSRRYNDLSRDQQIAQGLGLLKTLNSTEGKDAVGEGEAKRLGSFLQFKLFNISEAGSMFGRDIGEFHKQIDDSVKTIRNAQKMNADTINKTYSKYGIGSNSSFDPTKSKNVRIAK